MKQDPQVTVKVVPEIDHKAVVEAMAQVERDMRAAVHALAPVMQQVGLAFQEFGRAGVVLANRLREMAEESAAEQRRHLEDLKQQLTAGMVSRETVDAAIRKMEGREPVEKHIHPRDGGPLMTFRQEYVNQLPPITREEWEKYVSGKPPVKPDKTWCPRCQEDATDSRYAQDSSTQWRCGECHAVLVVPDPPVKPVDEPPAGG